jgi:hypothetical protein
MNNRRSFPVIPQEGSPMKSFRRSKIALLVALIGIGACASLSACIIDDGWGGHERHWR